MSDDNDDDSRTEISEKVQHLRDDLRQNLENIRHEQRHNKNDSIRIGIGELGGYLANLETFTADDVAKLANQIKNQKHANANDLNRLCHAFLQDTENIQCFLNVTGALNVLVKELTGKCYCINEHLNLTVLKLFFLFKFQETIQIHKSWQLNVCVTYHWVWMYAVKKLP